MGRNTPILDDLSSIHRRELILLLVLSVSLLVTGIGVVRIIGEAFAKVPGGLSYHLFYSLGVVFGVSGGQMRALAAFFVLGLFVLVALDEYKQIHGMLLLILSVAGFVLLNQRGVLIFDIARQSGPAVVGLAGGLVVGGLRRDSGWLPSHDALDTTGATGVREFRNSLSWVFLIASFVVVASVIESTVIYDSPIVYYDGAIVTQQFEIIDIRQEGLGSKLLYSSIFLVSIGLFRSSTSEKQVVIMGTTGTGKTSTMAGLANAATQYSSGTGVSKNIVLDQLESRLIEGKQFVSTDTTKAYPLKLEFKHGNLFPRKVTIRTLDYGGDHIENFDPITDEGDTVTEDIEQAFEIAKYEFAGSDGVIETNRDPEQISDVDPEEIDGLGDGKERIQTLIRDLVFYSDSIGLIYPMDDFAEDAIKEGCCPDYASIEDGGVKNPRPREEYKHTLNTTAKQYEGEKDLFAIASMADYVSGYFDEYTQNDHRANWQQFGQFVGEDLIGATLPGPVDSADVIPIYFPVEEPDGEDDDEEELVINADTVGDRHILHGAGPLLNRMGRWRLRDLDWFGGDSS